MPRPDQWIIHLPEGLEGQPGEVRRCSHRTLDGVDYHLMVGRLSAQDPFSFTVTCQGRYGRESVYGAGTRVKSLSAALAFADRWWESYSGSPAREGVQRGGAT